MFRWNVASVNRRLESICAHSVAVGASGSLEFQDSTGVPLRIFPHGIWTGVEISKAPYHHDGAVLAENRKPSEVGLETAMPAVNLA